MATRLGVGLDKRQFFLFHLFGTFAFFFNHPTLSHFYLAAPGLSNSMWDLSSLIRDKTREPCIGRQILNHWTTKEVTILLYYCLSIRGPQ